MNTANEREIDFEDVWKEGDDKRFEKQLLELADAIIDDINALPKTPKYAKTPITEFQPITRDFAFVVESKFAAERLIVTARNADSRIGDVTVFDSFEMGGGNKSVAFTITIYPTENMGDAELAEIQNKVISAVETKCHAKLRA